MRVLFLAFIFITSVTGAATAAKADIVDIQIKESYSKLMVSVNLRGAYTEKIKEAFQSGMPVVFTYLINLNRHRSVFWDATEKKVRVHKIVKYDSLSKEFNAIELIAKKSPRPEDFEKLLEETKASNRAKLTSDFSEAEEEKWRRYLVIKDITALAGWMSSLNNIPIGNKSDYPTNRKYYVEVKAEMDTIKLKPPFNYLFFFVSFMDFDTAWEASSPFIIEKADVPINKMVGQKK